MHASTTSGLNILHNVSIKIFFVYRIQSATPAHVLRYQSVVFKKVGLFMGHASSRPSRAIGAAASFITQQYEGRAGLDVSILPWNGELSLLSASLRLMDSPKVRAVEIRRPSLFTPRTPEERAFKSPPPPPFQRFMLRSNRVHVFVWHTSLGGRRAPDGHGVRKEHLAQTAPYSRALRRGGLGCCFRG